MRYSKASFEDYESRGIALNTGAAYAVGTLDDQELAAIESHDFSQTSWNDNLSLVHLHGPNGKQLIRFGFLDRAGKWVRFLDQLRRSKYASLALLKATAHEPLEFAQQQLQSAPFVHAQKPHKPAASGIGFVVGDTAKHYSSLVIVEAGRLRVVDLEPRVAGGGGREFSHVTPVNNETAKRTREAFLGILTSSRVDSTDRLSINTQIILCPK